MRAAAEKVKIDLGEGAETPGSFGGAVRRGWLDLKCAFTNGDEHTILVEVGGRAAIGRCVVF